jgi:transposase InsO family protein
VQIRRVHEQSGGACGSRRTWKQLKREGIQTGRCRVQRLMSRNGLRGAQHPRKRFLTVADEHAERPADPVNRAFVASRPNRLWVCDLTSEKTYEGFVYLAFALDVFSRLVVGWQTAEHLRTDLVLDALKMALHSLRDTPPAAFEAAFEAHALGTQAASEVGEGRSPRRPLCHSVPVNLLSIGYLLAKLSQ